MSNDKISDVGINIAEKATVIWNVADMLRGPFKPHEYGLVILPILVCMKEVIHALRGKKTDRTAIWFYYSDFWTDRTVCGRIG